MASSAFWRNGAFPWAESVAEGAGNLLECSTGPCSSRLLLEWDVPGEFVGTMLLSVCLPTPMFGTDGGLVLDKVSDASSLVRMLMFLVVLGDLVDEGRAP